MLELAGEIADGAVLWLCAPEYIRRVAAPAIERGRARAGKPLAGFEIVAAVPLALTDDVPRTRGAFRSELTRYLTLPFYRAMLDASGFREPLAEFDRSGEVPDVLVNALGAVGEAASCRAYVEAYRTAGATLPAVRPIGFPDAAWSRPTLEAAATW